MANIRDSQCGRTLQEHSVQTAEKISGASSKNSAKSKLQTFLSLNLKSGQKQEKSWEMISLSPTELLTLNTGIHPCIVFLAIYLSL